MPDESTHNGDNFAPNSNGDVPVTDRGKIRVPGFRDNSVLKTAENNFRMLQASLKREVEESTLVQQGQPETKEVTPAETTPTETQNISATINPTTGKPYPFFANHTEVMGKPYKNDGFRDR